MTPQERAAAAIGCKPDCPEHAIEIEIVAQAIVDAVAEARSHASTVPDIPTRDYPIADADKWRLAYAEAEKRAAEWKHEAECNAAKLASESRLKSRIAELEYCNERLVEQAARERVAFTKRRKDKAEQWDQVVAERDAARASEKAMGERVAVLEKELAQQEKLNDDLLAATLKLHPEMGALFNALADAGLEHAPPAEAQPQDNRPAHALDCAIAVNVRHGCTCGVGEAQPQATATLDHQPFECETTSYCWICEVIRRTGHLPISPSDDSSSNHTEKK